jgi:hypothetical protein
MRGIAHKNRQLNAALGPLSEKEEAILHFYPG